MTNWWDRVARQLRAGGARPLEEAGQGGRGLRQGHSDSERGYGAPEGEAQEVVPMGTFHGQTSPATGWSGREPRGSRQLPTGGDWQAPGKGLPHWGQGPVYPVGTLQVHHKEMDKVPTKNPSSTLQTHSEFPKPISLQCSQHRKCPVHSQCSRACDCSVPIR